MLITRFILITLAVYLLVRSFMRHGANAAQNDNQNADTIKFGGKKISKSIGEYVDYEEVDEEVRKAD